MIIFELLDSTESTNGDDSKAKNFLRGLLLKQATSNTKYAIIKAHWKKKTITGEIRRTKKSEPESVATLTGAKAYEEIVCLILKSAGLRPDKSILNPYRDCHIIPFYVSDDESYTIMECHIENRPLQNTTHLLFKEGTPNSMLMLNI